jgi:hypothetical protein
MPNACAIDGAWRIASFKESMGTVIRCGPSPISSTLSTGVIWVAAKKNQGYCFSSADARSYWPYFGASGGYAPITVALFEELLEASADFRRDLSDGSLRQLEPNRSMK